MATVLVAFNEVAQSDRSGREMTVWVQITDPSARGHSSDPMSCLGVLKRVLRSSQIRDSLFDIGNGPKL